MPINNIKFWEELKERNVIRVALAYAVTAWLLVQIGDIILPVFNAPIWMMQGLIIILISGFPIILIVVWFFEWTQVGIKKAGKTKKEKAIVRNSNKRINRIIVISLLLVIVSLVTEKIGLYESKEEPVLKTTNEAIAIFPFFIQASESFQPLGDGMVDLISAKLDNIPGLNATDPNILLSRVSESKLNTRNPAEVSQLAKELGANRFVLGTIIEIGGKLEIKLSKYDDSGLPIGKSISETADIQEYYTNIDNIIQRFVSQELKSKGQGFASDAILTTSNVESIATYLKGEQFMRKGQYKKAVEAYKESIAHDSLFILSYYRMFTAMSWVQRIYDWPNERKPIFDKLKANLDLLSGKNREIVDARIKFNSHHPETEIIYRRLIKNYGQSQALLAGLAETLFHLNESKGRSLVEAKPYLEKLLKYDSLNEEVKFHLMGIALYEQDSLTLNRMVSHLSKEHEAGFQFRMYALVLRDSVSNDDLLEISQDPNLDEGIINSTSGMFRLRWYNLLERMADQNQVIKSSLQKINQKRKLAKGQHLKYLQKGLKNPDFSTFSMLMAACLEGFPLLNAQENDIFRMIDFLSIDSDSLATENQIIIHFLSGLLHHSLNNEIVYKEDLSELLKYLKGDFDHYGKLNYYQLIGLTRMNGGQGKLGLLYFDSAANVVGNDNPKWMFLETLYGNIRSFWKAEFYAKQGQIQEAKSIYEIWLNSGDYGVLRASYWGLSMLRLGQIHQALNEDQKAIFYYKMFLDTYQNADGIYDHWKKDASEQLELLSKE